ncbi:MAG: hypothetical protein VYA21_07655 [Verrucomicrobiota bacterium]|nr:hypothetical protein [Verrucomicrobiota bacterium]
MRYLTLQYTRKNGNAINLIEPLQDWLLLVDAIRNNKTIQLHFEQGEDALNMWIPFAYVFDNTPESLLEILKECASYSDFCKVCVYE